MVCHAKDTDWVRFTTLVVNTMQHEAFMTSILRSLAKISSVTGGDSQTSRVSDQLCGTCYDNLGPRSAVEGNGLKRPAHFARLFFLPFPHCASRSQATIQEQRKVIDEGAPLIGVKSSKVRFLLGLRRFGAALVWISAFYLRSAPGILKSVQQKVMKMVFKWDNYVVNQCIFKGNRDESTTVDVAKAKKEAKDLFEVKLKIDGRLPVFVSVFFEMMGLPWKFNIDLCQKQLTAGRRTLQFSDTSPSNCWNC